MKKILLLCRMLIFYIGLAKAQQKRQISGKVTDKVSKEIIPGASVTLKGTSTVVSTDEKGQFKIAVPSTGSVVLQAKYLGYKVQEITVGTSSQVNFTLEDDVASLNEVV